MYLEKEFEEYLIKIQGLKESTIQSYLSTLRNNLEIILPKANFEKIVSDQDLYTIHNIQISVFDPKYGLSERTFDNFMTHFNRYKEFLIYYIEQKISDQEVLEEQDEFIFGDELIELDDINNFVHSSDEVLTLKKEDIKQNFAFRLITQNRFNSSGLYFPISFLKQYFYKTNDKEYFDRIISNQIDRIIVNVLENKERKTYTIKDLKTLSIKNGFAYFNDKPILSALSNSKDYIKLGATTLKNIAIDHIEPISRILENESKNIENFSQLSFISKSLKKYLNKPVTYKKLVGRGTKLSNDASFIEQIDKEKLKVEFEYFVNKIPLQLMCSKENRKKHNK